MNESQKPVTTNKAVITEAAYAGDIVSRLRNWRGLHLAHGGELFEEAAGEIEKLRSRLRLADAAIRSDTPTLTDAEREAVKEAADAYGDNNDDEGSAGIETALRGLLERLR